jgi:lysophospholipase L1-like esterase
MMQDNGAYVFNGGYRVELFRLATEAGHDITFTGTQTPNGPGTVAGVPFPGDHEGVSGDIISGIANRGVGAIEQEMPHIILVHAGTNDLNGMSQGMSDRLEDLMDDLIESAPDALLVVSSIIPFTGGEVAYNATIEPMIETRAGAGAHIIFVDQHAGFPNSQLGDGVHPNLAGYARMGAKWYEAIEGYLP